MTTLTPNKCHRAAPGRHYDGTVPGLHLYVRALATGNVSRGWVLRIKVNGRRRDIGLGRWPDISLTLARTKAIETRQAYASGRDVVVERKADARKPTFTMAAEAVANLKNAVRKADDGGAWLSMVKRHAFPHLGTMPVDQITKRDFLAVVQPLWRPADQGGKPATAKAVRVAVKNVMDWCEEQGHIEHNPAHSSFKQSLPPLRQGHRAAVTGEAAPGVYRTIATMNGLTAPATKLCLRLIALTAVRKTEARAATWAEVDMGNATWTIPADRMKAGQPHRVPLSPEAVAVFKEARTLDDGSGYVFPGQGNAPCVGQTTLTDLQRRVAPDTEVHGWRSTFRDWSADNTSAPHAVMELALAHAVGSQVERAYARSDLLDKRRVLMEQWADHLTGSGPDA